ncbi:MAG TPA: type II toxin-antitoxin system RelE/ParE family toxin [Acidobacteriaceae bacterium]
MEIRWTPAAAADFREISRYIEEERNLDTANRVCRRMYDAIQTLRSLPQLGRAGLRENTRELVHPSYFIVYRLHEDAAEILHICTGHRAGGRFCGTARII